MKRTALKRGTKRLKRTPLKRKSKNPRKTARDKAWKYFSKWIRLRDPRCVTCGAPTTQAGHFIHGVTDTWLNFDERNINGQCAHCNLYLSGNLIEYTEYIRSKYGQEALDELRKLRDEYQEMGFERPTIQDYRDIAEKYKKRLDEET